MKIEKIAEIIHEAARNEAIWSRRPVVSEPWTNRDEAFRKSFIDLIQQYLTADHLPTPEESHNIWMDTYFKMGWVHGEKRDPVAKTHPDLIPYDDLPQAEKDKDSIFLAFVWLAKKLLQESMLQ